MHFVLLNILSAFSKVEEQLVPIKLKRWRIYTKLGSNGALRREMKKGVMVCAARSLLLYLFLLGRNLLLLVDALLVVDASLGVLLVLGDEILHVLCRRNTDKFSMRRFAQKFALLLTLSASVNSISSIPSPVYQCRKAFLRNMAENCSATRLKSSWIAVELPMKVTAIFIPRGAMSQ